MRAASTNRTGGLAIAIRPTDVQVLARPARTILEKWEITADELTTLVEINPSLRGMMLGYVAELQLVKKFLSLSDRITYSVKSDDHDRGNKGDRVINYRGERFIVESKSLQTNTIKRVTTATGEAFCTAKAQVDASDCREVKFSDGSSVTTTCLLAGEFDILAVNCFAFHEKWSFVFAKNADLPRSRFRKYSPIQQASLLASLVTVTWPPQKPFVTDPFPLLEEIAADRKRRK